jgi:hypothetical protein
VCRADAFVRSASVASVGVAYVGLKSALLPTALIARYRAQPPDEGVRGYTFRGELCAILFEPVLKLVAKAIC